MYATTRHKSLFYHVVCPDTANSPHTPDVYETRDWLSNYAPSLLWNKLQLKTAPQIPINGLGGAWYYMPHDSHHLEKSEYQDEQSKRGDPVSWMGAWHGMNGEAYAAILEGGVVPRPRTGPSSTSGKV